MYPPLSREFLLATFSLDMATGELYWLMPSKYHSEKVGALAGCARRCAYGEKKYWRIRVNRLPYLRSRLVHRMVTGRWPEQCMDHINGDSLDDRPCNLREASITENAWNHKGRSKKSPLPMGVRYTKAESRFEARIAFKKKVLHLGCYDSPEEAAAVYLAKRKELYGEFA